MAIEICIIDQNENEILFIGILETDDLINLIKMAEIHQFKYLPCIDFVGYTIFNQEQLKYLAKEILIFKEIPNSDKKSLEIIGQAVLKALSLPRSYLLFGGE